jgi:hypothetical protein
MNNCDDNIRPPDEVKQEQLINYDFDINDDFDTNQFINPIWSYDSLDLDTILELSQNEFNLQQEFETELICNQIKEEQYKERQHKFNNIKIQLNKIILFDRDNIYYYELILSIIQMYESGVINEYTIVEFEYNNLIKIINTFRLPSDEINNLKKIISIIHL